jgi:hypothetical protein
MNHVIVCKTMQGTKGQARADLIGKGMGMFSVLLIVTLNNKVCPPNVISCRGGGLQTTIFPSIPIRKAWLSTIPMTNFCLYPQKKSLIVN